MTGTDLGYLYGVRVARAGISFDLQGYDLSWAAQGDACDMTTLDNATTARNPWVTDETTRYAKGKTAFCTGDSSIDKPEGDGNTAGSNSPTKVKTIINVYEPSTTPWRPLDAPLICSVTLNGWDDTTKLSLALNATSPQYDSTLAQYFRRWQSICRVNGAKLGDYTVQIRTVGVAARTVSPCGSTVARTRRRCRCSPRARRRSSTASRPAPRSSTSLG